MGHRSPRQVGQAAKPAYAVGDAGQFQRALLECVLAVVAPNASPGIGR